MQPWIGNVSKRFKWFLKKIYWEPRKKKKKNGYVQRWNCGRRPCWLHEHLLNDAKCRKGAYQRWTRYISCKSWSGCLWDYCLLSVTTVVTGEVPNSWKGLKLHLPLETQERKLPNYLLISIISVTRRAYPSWDPLPRPERTRRTWEQSVWIYWRQTELNQPVCFLRGNDWMREEDESSACHLPWLR